MIIDEIHGNIFNSNMQSLIVPVNTVGTMGKGLALEFKRRFPGLNTPYRTACWTHVFDTVGFFTYHDRQSEKKIVCLPTKLHWRDPSKLEYIEKALFCLNLRYQEYGIASLAIPAVGCGLGQLGWADVYPLIIRYLDPISIPVEIYLPD